MTANNSFSSIHFISPLPQNHYSTATRRDLKLRAIGAKDYETATTPLDLVCLVISENYESTFQPINWHNGRIPNHGCIIRVLEHCCNPRKHEPKKASALLWRIAEIRENHEPKKAERVSTREFTDVSSEILNFL